MPDSAAVAGRVVTVAGWLEHWLATRVSQRASTLRGYRSHVRVYLTPYLGRIPLAELTVGQVQAMFTALSRQLGSADGPNTAASLARIRTTLRAGLNAALRQGLIPVNPPAGWNCHQRNGRGRWCGPGRESRSGNAPGCGRR
jgi:hypothetical protein